MTPTLGPPVRKKPIHLAAKIREGGAVSPACAAKPRAIDLRTASWTIVPEQVTCPRCRRAIRAGTAPLLRPRGAEEK